MPVCEYIEDYMKVKNYPGPPFMTKEDQTRKNNLITRFNKEDNKNRPLIQDNYVVTDEQYAEIRKIEEETHKLGIDAYIELQKWLHCGDYNKYQEWLKSKRNNNNDTNRLS